MHNAALDFRDAYLDYIPNYPIAGYRMDHEMANNPQFRAFVEVSVPCCGFPCPDVVPRIDIAGNFSNVGDTLMHTGLI